MTEERRYTAAATLELRAGGKIAGYAAVFNTLSNELPLPGGRKSFREIIRPGAFAAALASGDDVLARFEHSELLGRTGNGTLRLYEDSRGLRYEIDPPNTSAGRDVLELIRRRDVAASSFAMIVNPGGDAWRREGSTLIREIRSVRLIDVSPVARPAYPETDAALRSLEAAKLPTGERHSVRMGMRLALASRR
jgi:HK97 family phage prohead protease